MKNFIVFLLLLSSTLSSGQSEEKKVLFLGNSYTSFNNLPNMIANMASSVGDNLNWDAETSGGYYLSDHLNAATAVNKIESGDWDYVVLQDQSQVMSLPTYQLPFTFNIVAELDSLINHYNPCTETMFYMTWGRKNGDSLFYQVYSPWYEEPTYEFMDSLIHARYMQLSVMHNAEVSPVGAVWRYIRENHPSIELYHPDGSHPSLAGSYAAACCFYTALFRNDPTLISFNSSLSATEATIIKEAAKLVVYDSLANWNIGVYDSSNNIDCTTSSQNIIHESEHSMPQLFPNPAKSILTVSIDDVWDGEYIQIYNTSGMLLMEIEGLAKTQINIEDLENGVYFVRLKNHPNKTLKFIKN